MKEPIKERKDGHLSQQQREQAATYPADAALDRANAPDPASMAVAPMPDATPGHGADLTNVLDLAVKRLDLALGALEGAAGRRMELARTQAGLNEALAAMQDDRSRLALDLDATLARAKRLDQANEVVAQRLDEAGACLIDLIQSTLPPSTPEAPSEGESQERGTEQ